MKRNERQLETESGDHEHHTDQQQRTVDVTRRDQGFNPAEFHSPELRINQRHAEQQKPGGCGREDEVLDACFKRQDSVSQIGIQRVQRDAQDLETQEERHKMIAGDQNHRAQHGYE